VSEAAAGVFLFHGRCGHAWDLGVVLCTAEALPSCACGDPLYPLTPGQCPECGREPTFLEIPMWSHMGPGLFNIESIQKLEIYK
jgi:hypothetical protein